MSFFILCVFTCFCLKELLQLEWGLFIFHVPEDFYFLAFNSVHKGWFIKCKKEKIQDKLLCLQLLYALPPLGAIITQGVWVHTGGLSKHSGT